MLAGARPAFTDPASMNVCAYERLVAAVGLLPGCSPASTDLVARLNCGVLFSPTRRNPDLLRAGVGIEYQGSVLDTSGSGKGQFSAPTYSSMVIRCPHQTMHLFVFLHELLAVELIFGFIATKRRVLVPAQDPHHGLLIRTLDREEQCIGRGFGRRKRLLLRLLREGRPGDTRSQDSQPDSRCCDEPSLLPA